jgi:hypothetical protein
MADRLFMLLSSHFLAHSGLLFAAAAAAAAAFIATTTNLLFFFLFLQKIKTVYK